METAEILDVTKIEPKHKHPTIFRYFDALQPGENFIIENDHDPKPLYYELLAERGPIFSWEYLEQGPEVFKVNIKKNEKIPPQQKTETLRVSALEPRLKHPTVFQWFDALKAGQAFVIENDHDPRPLYYELLAERGNIFTWEYLEKGPEVFRVKIEKKVDLELSGTSAAIPEKDVKKAQLLKEKGVEFNCADSSPNSAISPRLDYANWELDFLADYIANTHHRYIKDHAENVNDLANKVAEHHGADYPELNRVATAVYHFLQDLVDHVMKEEEVFFPVVKQIATKLRNPEVELTYEVGTVSEPVAFLTKDLEIAKHDLNFLRNLTNKYTVPENACSSFALLYRQIQEFEKEFLAYSELELTHFFPRVKQSDEEFLAKK